MQVDEFTTTEKLGIVPTDFFVDEVLRQAMPQFKLWKNHLRDLAKKDELSRDYIEFMLNVITGHEWPSLDDCIPGGGILHAVDEVFFHHSDVPRELPFAAMLHYIAALLLREGVRLEAVAKQTISPDIWTVALADSGTGKSFAMSRIKECLGGDITEFEGGDSSAKFMDNLTSQNNGLWVVDEFGLYLKKLETVETMMPIKRMLMTISENSPVGHSSLSNSFSVERPALTIFGATVIDTITKQLTAESLVDGLASRFMFILPEKDSRPMMLKWTVAENMNYVLEKWNKIRAAPRHALYKISPEGDKAFQEAFNKLVPRSEPMGIKKAFLRRVMWAGNKYGLLYHVLLGKAGDTLDEEDMTYAARLVALNLRNLRRLLDLYEKTWDQKAEELLERHIKRLVSEGEKKFAIRKLQQRSGVKAKEIRELLPVLFDRLPELASHIEDWPESKGAVGVAGGAAGFTGKKIMKRSGPGG